MLMKSLIIFTLTAIILEMNMVLGCKYIETQVLPSDDPNFEMNSLPNIYNWDQMMIFIPVTKNPEYKVAKGPII